MNNEKLYATWCHLQVLPEYCRTDSGTIEKDVSIFNFFSPGVQYNENCIISCNIGSITSTSGPGRATSIRCLLYQMAFGQTPRDIRINSESSVWLEFLVQAWIVTWCSFKIVIEIWELKPKDHENLVKKNQGPKGLWKALFKQTF